MFSIVLPIKCRENGEFTNDYKLFSRVGSLSYEKFLDISNLDGFYIICPYAEIQDVHFAIKFSKIPYRIMSEESLLDRKVYECQGWFKQQLLKLAIVDMIQTSFYLVLDADMYLTQKLCYKDLFNEGKIKYNSEPWQTENNDKYSTNSNWWMNSSRILDFDYRKLQNKKLMSVTPEILVKKIVHELVNYVKKMHPDWQHHLVINRFTEFTLYWIFIIMNNHEDLYTTAGFPLWKHDSNTNIINYGQSYINVRNSFEQPTSFFSVIQGYIRQDLEPLIQESMNFIGKSYTAIFITASMLKPNRFQSIHPVERFQQTLNTVNSIRKYVPNSFCILIEGSVIPEDIRAEYKKHYDHVIELGDNPDVQKYVNHSQNIGHGEMKLLEHGIEYIQKNILPTSSAKYLFKLGARYSLTDKFSLPKYRMDKYTFRPHYDESVNSKVFTTGLYSIPMSKIQEFKEILIKGQDILSSQCNMVEKLFVDLIKPEDIHEIKTLGLEGMLSYNRKVFSV